MNEVKTVFKIVSGVDGVFDKDNIYVCIETNSDRFTKGVQYKGNCAGVIDDLGLVNNLGSLENKMSKAKTISELFNIDGAFDEGDVYECVTSGGGYFSKGGVYKCNGGGIVDNDGGVLKTGHLSTFKLVTPKEENKTMRTPFNLERALAGDKVVDKDGGEYNQFSVIKTLNSTLINCYSVGGDCSKTYSEKAANTVLFMAPKMGKGFVNVYNSFASGYDTRELADENASPNRIMCIDLSQFPKGYGL